MPTQLISHDINWPNIGWRAAAVVATWLAIWYLVRHMGRWVDRLYAEMRGHPIDRRELRSLDALGDGILITIGVIITLAILELTPLLMSMLTAAGVTGVIIGFAVKDVAANLIAGFFLLIDHPFSLGDFVAAGNVQGTVEQISLRSSRIRTLEGPVVTVPNSVIAANAITNYTVNPLRRIEIALTLPPDADIDRATRLLLDLAAAEPRLAPDVQPQVIVGDLRDFSFDLKLICQAPNRVWFQTQSDLKRALLIKAREANLPGVLPAQKVYTAVYTAPIPQEGGAHG